MLFIFHLKRKILDKFTGGVEIYPITKPWSGLERGYGVFLNDVSPEDAAEKLGAASRKELANLVGII